jgi:hypothetical protein
MLMRIIPISNQIAARLNSVPGELKSPALALFRRFSR